ncbi:MAG: FxSxx-COOH system tetratricopeptide repeat protein [Chloroflexota bacterium]
MAQFKLLGSFAVEVDGVPSDLIKSDKGSALLIYLIVTRESQLREKVADIVWDATSTKKAQQNLRQLLSSSLKGKVDELLIERKTLTFAPTAETTVDLYMLDNAFTSDDLKEIDAALKCYKGDLLADFYLHDAPRFNEWLLVAREQLRQRVQDRFRYMCTAYEQAQRWTQGINLVRHWLTLDNLNENAHRALMRFLKADGQIEAALQQFDDCQRLMRDELGIEPESETLRLAAEIKEMARPGTGELAAPGLLPSNAYLPFHRNAIFTGRQDELREMANRLFPSPENESQLLRATVVSGMGGLGKSQLAVEYAYRYGRFYPGGVFWINFADPENVDEEVAAIGGESGLGLYTSKESIPLHEKIKRIRQAWQEPIPRLLIFDNCEDEMVAAEWLPISGGCSVLITSRQTHWSKALPLTLFSLGALKREESILFLQKLKDNLHAKEADLVAKVVGDLPLALHLAGSFLGRYQTISTQAYLQQLEGDKLLAHQSFQGGHIRYSPTGHALSIDQTFSTSLQQLDLDEHFDSIAYHLLAHAACFKPNEPIPTQLLYNCLARERDLSASHEILPRGLIRLSDLGFINFSDQHHITMHQLLSQFMLKRLGSGLRVKVEKAIEGTLIDVLKQHKKERGYLIEMPFATSHLRIVTDRALAREDRAATQLASLLSAYLVEIADLTEARHYLDAALKLTERLFGKTSLEMAEIVSSMGNLLMTMGRFKHAEPYFQQALTIHLREHGEDHFDTANSLNQMGHVRIKLGPYASAEPYLKRALAVRKKLLGLEHPLTTGSLNNLGALYNFMGDEAQARLYFEEVLAIRDRILGPDHLHTATALNNLGDLLTRTGNAVHGEPYLSRSVKIREAHLGIDHPLTLSSKTNWGESLGRLGRFEEAEEQISDALDVVLGKLGEYHPLTARIINTIGVLYMRMSRFKTSENHLLHALDIRDTVRGRAHVDTAYTLVCLGDLYLETREVEKGQAYYEEAEEILTEIVEPHSSGLIQVRQKLATLAHSPRESDYPPTV